MAVAATVAASKMGWAWQGLNTGFTLPELPYGYDALDGVVDKQTMMLHHDKHHAGYVKKLNEALGADHKMTNADLPRLMQEMAGKPEAVRNNGGGHYNHTLFWQMMSPKQTTTSSALQAAIKRDFGTMEEMKAAFEKAAKERFGSGWAWLSKGADGKLFISSTPNQDNPMMNLPDIKQGTPILGLDVWEHAYYLKYQNQRAEYVSNFWKIVNWEECSRRFSAK